MKLARYFPLCALCVSAVIAAAAPAQPRVFHVSKDGPIASLEQARDAVRALKRDQGGALKQPVTVFVHGGTYTLSRPVTFTPEDSGSAECPVVYRAYGNEAPVFSGGRAITGWKQTVVEDPARRDFRLKPDSPALRIGFQPFDLSGTGPRPAVLENLRSRE